MKVTIIAIHTPQTVKPNTPLQPYPKQPSNYTNKHLTHKYLYLHYHKQKNHTYPPTLAYVSLSKNTIFNTDLVHKGLPTHKYYSPNA
ncbi:thermonuclease family protein, partial [Staphylococcus capitis]|uniref:thermonuclease family protein n=1 Tax=Staphylococcus capitis TaxID=29388 RepID=UPI0028CB1D6F